MQSSIKCKLNCSELGNGYLESRAKTGREEEAWIEIGVRKVWSSEYVHYLDRSDGIRLYT